MTLSAPAEPSPRLYSQTEHDDRGNFHYEGDLYRPADDLPTLCHRIERHLASQLPEIRFAIRSERFSGGRKITVEVLDAPEDLSTRDAQEAFIVRVRDQIERFGFCRTNPLQDYWNCSFYSEVCIRQAYWAALGPGAARPIPSTIWCRWQASKSA